MSKADLAQRALEAADRCLKSKGYIALDDVFVELGALQPKDREDWRLGRVPFLERVIQMNLARINAVCQAVHTNSRNGGLRPSWTAYVQHGKGGRRPLQFTKSGAPTLERNWATRYVCPKPTSKEPGKTTPPTPNSVAPDNPVSAEARSLPGEQEKRVSAP